MKRKVALMLVFTLVMSMLPVGVVGMESEYFPEDTPDFGVYNQYEGEEIPELPIDEVDAGAGQDFEEDEVADEADDNETETLPEVEAEAEPEAEPPYVYEPGYVMPDEPGDGDLGDYPEDDYYPAEEDEAPPPLLTPTSDDMFTFGTIGTGVNMTAVITGFAHGGVAGGVPVLTFPSTNDDGLRVTHIAAAAFEGNTVIQHITLPEGIENIQQNAFRNAVNLQTITLPNTLTTIGQGAFYNANLLQLTIPNSVVTIASANSVNNRTFGRNTNLATVNIGTGLRTIPAGAFFGNTALSSVNFGGVTTIGESAFDGNIALTSLDLADTVIENINATAFVNTRLESVVFPTSLRTIGANAFRDVTTLTSITLPPGIATIGGGAFNNTRIVTLNIPNTVSNIVSTEATGAGGRTFGNNPALTSVYIGTGLFVINAGTFQANSALTTVFTGANVATIHASAFRDNNSLSDVTFGNSLETINANAFRGTRSLNEITFPNNLVTIGSGAFNNSAIINLVIPDSVTSIASAATVAAAGGRTFGDNQDLRTVTIGTGLVTISAGTFAGNPGLQEIVFTDGNRVANIMQDAFLGPNSLSSITFPSSLRHIYTNAFRTITALQEVNFNEGLLTIGNGAFNNTRIVNLIIPNSVTSITSTTQIEAGAAANRHTFGNNPSMESLTVGTSLVSIEAGTFRGNSNLSVVTFASTGQLNSIGRYAFENTSIERLDFPTSLRTIGRSAFRHITALNYLDLNNVASIANGAFYNTRIRDLVIPPSVYQINSTRVVTTASPHPVLNTDRRTFGNNNNLRSVTVQGNTLSHIFPGTFMNNPMLAEVNIGGVTVIEDSAFRDNPLLSTINLGTSLSRIEIDAFRDAINLPSLNLPASLVYVGSSAFRGAEILATVNFQDSGLIEIGNNAFQGTIITEAHFPNSLRTIGQFAFNNIIELESLKLNNGLESIGIGAFTGIRHRGTLTIPNSVNVIGSNFANPTFGLNPNLIQLDIGTGIEVIQEGTFRNNVNLAVANIQPGVRTVGASAFRSNTSLGHIRLPGVITIGDHAFRDNTTLNTAHMDVVETIGNYAFDNTISLWDLRMGNHVLTIGNRAFRDARNIGSRHGYLVNLPDTLERIGNEAFFGAGNLRLTRPELPANLIHIGASAFRDCVYITAIIFNPMLEFIGAGAFRNTRIRYVEIPPNVVTIQSTIANPAFGDNPHLYRVTIGNGLQAIQAGTFRNNSGLVYVRIGQNVLEIGQNAFEYNTSLATLNLLYASRLAVIDHRAFRNTSLTTLDLPSAMRTIGSRAFMNVTALRSINLNSVTAIYEGAFYNTRIVHLTIPDTVENLRSGVMTGIIYDRDSTGGTGTNAGNRTFGANPDLETVHIGSRITTIHPGTFHGATSLRSVNLGNIQHILHSAFFGNTSLETITMPVTLESIGRDAFRDSGLRVVNFNEGLHLIHTGAFNRTRIEHLRLPNSLVHLHSLNTDVGSTFGRIAQLDTVYVGFDHEGGYDHEDALLTGVTAGVFRGSGVRQVRLGNRIGAVHPGAFQNTPRLEWIMFYGAPPEWLVVPNSPLAGVGSNFYGIFFVPGTDTEENPWIVDEYGPYWNGIPARPAYDCRGDIIDYRFTDPNFLEYLVTAINFSGTPPRVWQNDCECYRLNPATGNWEWAQWRLRTTVVGPVLRLSPQNRNIESLNGIELFTSLRDLNVANNLITTLDLSNNEHLRHVNAVNNQLTSINVSSSEGLLSLYVTNNRLGSLDIRNNTLLMNLDAERNYLTELDLTYNLQIRGLFVRNNAMLHPILQTADFTRLIGWYPRSTHQRDDLIDGIRLGFMFTPQGRQTGSMAGEIRLPNDNLYARITVWQGTREVDYLYIRGYGIRAFRFDNIPGGIYSLTVTMPRHLGITVRNLLVEGGDTPFDLTNLRNIRLYPGDLNNDSVINSLDLAHVINNFGSSFESADVNGDGYVNAIDLSQLLNSFGRRATVG